MAKVTLKITFLLSIAAAFEYYNFIIYSLMASYLGEVFFPSDSLIVSQLQAFAVLALGYIARPLGGIVLGALGDLTSRKNIFIKSSFGLALATFLISLLPSYSSIGVLATIMIILLRLFQSFCFATEIPGSMVLISDNNAKPQEFSFIISSASIGSIIAFLIAYFIEANFSKEEIINYAWRIPFVFGGVLCAFSVYMRKKIKTSIQEKPKNKGVWFAELIAEYKKAISSILVISICAYIVITNLFFPSILTKFYGFQVTDIYACMIFSMFWCMVFGPSFAYLTSKLNKITLIQIAISLCIFLSFLVHYLFSKGNLLLGLLILQTINTSIIVTIFPLMNNIFFSKARFTILGVCYNLTYAIISYLLTLVVKLVNDKGDPLYIWAVLSLLCIISLSNMQPLYKND